MSDDRGPDEPGDPFDEDGDDGWDAGDDPDDLDDPAFLPLDDREVAQVQRDLEDLQDLETTFRPDGYRGVALFCHDCVEEHLYPWDMLRENLRVLIETGETPVHEPAFAPDPARYIPWDYARGYVDCLRETGIDRQLDVDACPRCRLPLAELGHANFCPRCAAPLLLARLRKSLLSHGVDTEVVETILREAGLPSPPGPDEA